MGRARQAIFGCVLAALWAAASPGIAETRDPVAAEALFREGRAAADSGDYEAARVKFAESYRFDPTIGALFNLAHAEEKVGLVATAWHHYLAVIEKLPREDRRRAFAEERVADLSARLPRLTVRAGGALPDGVTVARDGVLLGGGSLAAALPVDPGAHTVVVRGPGRPDRRYEVTVREGESVELVVEPAPLHPVAPAPVPPAAALPPDRKPAAPAVEQAESSTDLRPLGWALGSAGLLGIALGTVCGILALDKGRIVKANCTSNLRCNQQGFDAAQAGSTWATVSTVAFAVGVPATGAGVYLVLRGGGSGAAAAGRPAAGFTVAGSF
jgi:hypothetical protein